MAPTDKSDSKAIKARLDRLRRAERPKQIFKALQAIDAETETLKLEQLPELLRMIRVLINLQELVEVYGIDRYFMEWPEPMGAYGADAVTWCRMLGADRLATYVERALSLFPDGRAPADGAAGLLAVEKIQETAPNAFLELDNEFKGAEAEIPALLRQYLLTHEEALSQALASSRIAVRTAATFPAVLEARDPLEFLERLVDLVAPQSGAARMAAWASAEPNAATMLQALHGFYLDVGAGGIGKFLSSQILGGFAMQGASWCRALGAHRSAQYLDDTAALFPRGRIPSDDDARADIVERLIDDHRGPGLDPLRQLDQRYHGAADEMVEALRAYLRKHVEAPLPALEALARGR